MTTVVMEPLEFRRLLAVTATVSNHVLVVTGTSSDDDVLVESFLTNRGGSAHIDGQVTVFSEGGTVLGPLLDITSTSSNLGDGDDKIDLMTALPDTVDGGNGTDSFNLSRRTSGQIESLSAPNEALATFMSVEDLIGTQYVDTLIGDSGNNDIYGGGGNDWLRGEGGDDTLYGEAGDDRLEGDDGNDVIISVNSDGADTLEGDAGVDTADYQAKTNPISVILNGFIDDGESGEHDYVMTSVEQIFGGSADDVIDGSAVSNGVTLFGTNGDDSLVGGAGNDAIYGGNQQDTMVGGTGNDFLAGNDGNDQMYGAGGNDVMQGGLGADNFWGDAGNDEADYTGYSSVLSITFDGTNNDGPAGESDNVQQNMEILESGNAADTIDASAMTGPVTLYGNGGGDTITGSQGDCWLDGGDDNDYVSANNGNDTVTGGAGADSIFGGYGNDVMYSLDGITETVSGGPGTDSAHADASDILKSIESTF